MSSAAFTRKRHFDLRAFLLFIGLTFGVAFISSMLGGFSSFESLKAPPLTPPAEVFPIVWGVLYFFMAVAAYLVWNSGDVDVGPILRLYLLQLIVNGLWPLFFFRLQWRLFAFFWLLFLIALVSLTLSGFRYIRKAAYWLMLPYLLWCLYAAYLNLGFYLLNT